MPWATINIMEGRSDEMKRDLHKKVSAAIAEALNVPEEKVRIQIVDMQPVDHSIGGVTIDQLRK
jgi:4-oxalocrotonate tautomerase